MGVPAIRSDLHISERQLELFVSDYDEVPYDMLKFMVANINYGGRVTDALDQRAITVMLQAGYTLRVLLTPIAFVALRLDVIHVS